MDMPIGGILKRNRLALAGAAVAIVCVGAVILIHSFSRTPEHVQLQIRTGSADLEIRDVRFQEVSDDDSRWEIQAALAKYVKKENVALFERIRIQLLRSDGGTYLLTGDRARLRTDTRDLELTGHVTLVTHRGETVQTDRLRYDHAGRRILTDDPVTLEGRGIRVQGVGMKISLADRDLRLTSKVRAEVTP